MARPNRHYIPGYVWHLTHRCHRRETIGREIIGEDEVYELNELREPEIPYILNFTDENADLRPKKRTFWTYLLGFQYLSLVRPTDFQTSQTSSKN